MGIADGRPPLEASESRRGAAPWPVAPLWSPGRRLRAWSWIPVPILFVATVSLSATQPQAAYESPRLLAALNFAFYTVASAFVAWVVARSFLARGAPALLMLGGGVVAFGATSVAASAFGRSDANLTITIHNLGVLLAGGCHVVAALSALGPKEPVRRRRVALAAAYAAPVAVLAAVATAAARGALPVFFVQGQGGTPLRQAVLASAVATFAAASAVLWSGDRDVRSAFRHWYAVGLAFVAVGLFGVLIQSSFGSAGGWVGRAAQYVGSLCMLASAAASARDAPGGAVPLDALLRQSEARYRALFQNMTEGFFLAQVLCDASGEPADFRFLDANPAFETLTGLARKDVVGRTLAEVVPGAEPDWVATYGRVALTGAPARLDLLSRALGRHYVTTAYSPAPGQFACLFSDATARKRAEEALRASEEEARARAVQLEVVLDCIADGVLVYDREGRTVRSTPAADEILGIPAGERAGPVAERVARQYEILDEDGRRLGPDEMVAVRAAVRGEKVPGALYRVRSGEREPRWLIISGAPLYVSGQHTGGVVSLTDVTERRRVQEELAQVSRLYAVLSRVNEAIVRLHDERALLAEVCRVCADDGRFPLVWVALLADGGAVAPAASAGHAAEALRDVERAGALGGGATGTCLREERPVVEGAAGADAWRSAAERSGLAATAAFPLRRGGRVAGALTFHAASTGAFTAEQVKLLEALCADVSYALDAIEQEVMRGQAERALRESEQRFRALADSMVQLAWTARPDGAITWYNRRWYEYTGTTPAQVAGWGWHVVHDPARLPEVLERWGASIARGADFELEFPLRGADGRFRRFLTRAFPLKGEDGTVLQWFGTNTDVTDLVEAREALREAARRKDEYLAMLSHELRNPLAPIRNALYVLRHADPAGDRAARARDIVERQVEHLTRIVDDLLDVTRIARGRIELRRERVDLRDVVGRAGEDFRALMDERGLRFEVVLPGARAWADADATRVVQVIGNMLHNAARYARRGDAVTLALRLDGAAAEISVHDTGPGLDPALLPRVFEAFVQGERTLARTEGGLGLGLALVKGIAELHGGSARAESAGPGQGAEFVVRLPLAAGAAAGAEAAAAGAGGPPRGASGARRVLVVDDNVDAAQSLADIAEVLGRVVDVAYDGPSAIEKARANPPELVLCDIGLPGMSGYEVAKALRAMCKGVRLVAVTGYAHPEDVRRAALAGFDAHVAKPCDAAQIERLLG